MIANTPIHHHTFHQKVLQNSPCTKWNKRSKKLEISIDKTKYPKYYLISNSIAIKQKLEN